MIQLYLFFLCRISIGLIYAISSISKAKNISAFEQSVANFKLLPSRFVRIAAYLLIVSEFIVAFSMLIGSSYILLGLGLAVFLLFIFSFGIASALIRRMHISCNCFGVANSPISIYDLVRNAVFLLCAIVGLAVYLNLGGSIAELDILDIVLVGVWSATLVTLMTNLADIAAILRQRSNITH